MMKSLIATGVVALLAAGCTSVPAKPVGEAPAGSNRPGGSATAAADGSGSTGGASKKKDGTAPFGEAYTWDDGLSLTVGQPETYEPGKWAAKGDQKHFVVFDVRDREQHGRPLGSGAVPRDHPVGERGGRAGIRLPEVAARAEHQAAGRA